MRKPISFCVLLTVISALVVAPGCYTLLKHPKVKRVVYEEVNDKRCNTCHYEDELWGYHHPPNHRYGYGLGYESWEQYYLVPWWYNNYWYYDSNDAATVPLPSRRLRPATDRLGETPGRTLRNPSARKPISAPVKTESDKKGKSNEEPSKKRTVRPKKQRRDRGGKGKD